MTQEPVKTKVCKDCGQEKVVEGNFTFIDSQRKYIKPWCKKCEYQRQKDTLYKAKVEGAREKYAVVVTIKEQLGCQVCSENDHVCLDFHHIDPGTKKGMVYKMINSASSWVMILEEIEKCALLCANCHRKAHWGHLIGVALTPIVVPLDLLPDSARQKWQKAKKKTT